MDRARRPGRETPAGALSPATNPPNVRGQRSISLAAIGTTLDSRAMKAPSGLTIALATFLPGLPVSFAAALQSDAPGLTLKRDHSFLIIQGAAIPGGDIRINYLEAYCRAGSTDADWVKHTVIPHTNELVSASPDGREIRLRDTLADGLIVDHTIRAGHDEVTFELIAHNPTNKRSEAHWAQPCVRLGAFTGFSATDFSGNIDDYLPKCFIFLDGKLTRLPTPVWEKKARYTPGQEWAAPGVPRTDVNPRPLNPLTPGNGLIGCFSGDNSMIFATAWEPYQELFQGVVRCLHSDFRLGGIGAGETRRITGRIYLVPNDVSALLARYRRDFPNQSR
jgi:hypothetical protein